MPQKDNEEEEKEEIKQPAEVDADYNPHKSGRYIDKKDTPIFKLIRGNSKPESAGKAFHTILIDPPQRPNHESKPSPVKDLTKVFFAMRDDKDTEQVLEPPYKRARFFESEA